MFEYSNDFSFCYAQCFSIQTRTWLSFMLSSIAILRLVVISNVIIKNMFTVYLFTSFIKFFLQIISERRATIRMII